MTASRPSDLLAIADPWTAYQLDSAVSLVGTAIENLANELHEVGGPGDKKLVPRYTMDQLLDPGFLFPRPPTAVQRERNGIAALRAMARRQGSGVKLWKGR